MGLFPFADTSIPNHIMSDGSGSAVRWSEAPWRAGWCQPNPPASIRQSAPAYLPLDDHHDIDIDFQCTRRRLGVAGAPVRAVALRLP
jgi:hypothetical protein